MKSLTNLHAEFGREYGSKDKIPRKKKNPSFIGSVARNALLGGAIAGGTFAVLGAGEGHEIALKRGLKGDDHARAIIAGALAGPIAYKKHILSAAVKSGAVGAGFYGLSRLRDRGRRNRMGES